MGKFNFNSREYNSTWNHHELFNLCRQMTPYFPLIPDFPICRLTFRLTAQTPRQNRSILRSLLRCELIWNLLSLGHRFLSMKNSLSNGAFQTYNSSENRISDTNTRAGLSLDRPTSECHYLYNGLMKLGADKGGWKFN